MRVLWFSHVPFSEELDGTGSWINVLASYLMKENKIELHIAYRENCKVIEKSQHKGVFLYRIPSIEKSYIKNHVLKFIGLDISRFNTSNYLKTIALVKPDVVHLFGFENDFGQILPKTNIPTIMYIQSIYRSVATKWYSGFSERDIKKFSSFKTKLTRNTFNHQYRRHVIKRANEDVFFKNCSNVIGRTNWDKRCAHILAPQMKYHHCDEVVRKEFFDKRWQPSIGSNEYRIASIIGGSIYKGFETIIECMDILKQTTYNNIYWHVIGLSNSDEVVKICKRKYKPLNFVNIILHGRLKAEKIIEQLAICGVYVHPSHIENSSNAISEAMAFGMPVIATFTGGTNTLIDDEKSGVLIQDGEPLSLAGAIIELYNNPEKAKDLGENSRSTAKERHNPTKIMKDLINIYHSTICQIY